MAADAKEITSKALEGGRWLGFLFKMFFVAELIHTNGPLLFVCMCDGIHFDLCAVPRGNGRSGDLP